MKKRSSTYRRLFIAFAMTLVVNAPVSAYQWKASIVPASLNADNNIKLLEGQTQELSLMLQADQEVTSRADTHNIVLEWDLPTGLNIVGNGGVLKFSNPTTKSANGRTLTKYEVQVANNFILGAPGSTLSSEWQNQSVFVKAPDNLPAGQNFIRLKLTDGDYTEVFQWPLNIEPFAPAIQRPRRVTLGLWDYGYAHSNNQVTAEGIAKLFANSGITFTHYAEDPLYLKALRTVGVLTGGNTHHSHFYRAEFSDYDAKGNAVEGHFSDPQAITNLPKDAVIPGVKQLLDTAKAGDGIATFDYEPDGWHGFSPQAIASFKQKYNVTDTDFNRFREYVATQGTNTHLVTDATLSAIWKNWTQFRTEQTSAYMRRIYEAFKAQNPQARLALTTTSTIGSNSPSSLARGIDSSAMSRHTDIIMPQIYNGYGAANTKLTMQQVERWHKGVHVPDSKTELWPILMVRYAGASVVNSPQRVRQQVIGSLSHGAKGILLYYPSMMDAPYWQMMARTSEDVAQYENFYLDGKRVENEFPLSQLPQGHVEVTKWPGFIEKVQNPGWSFTAHRLENKTLLTLMNLEEANDLVFGFNIKDAEIVSVTNANQFTDGQWLVAPGQIGFIVIEHA